jgi:zinc/manganese transport system substrate-binding protein
MNYKIIFSLSLWLIAPMAQAKLNVVATLPDFGAIAQEIGCDDIKVTTLARGTEDPHFVDAKPSFIRVLNQADVLLEGGAELELGWLPPLVNNARNAKILSGKSGHVKMSKGVPLLELPTGPVDRSMGDVHPTGNPHYWLNPAHGKIMAAHLANVFSELDPENAQHYRTHLKEFDERLDKKIAEWKQQMEPYRGAKIVTYHKSYEYFADFFGLEVVGQLEPKPGIEPSPSHISALIPRMKSDQVKLLLIEPNRSRKTPEYVANATGAKLVIIPGMVGGHEKAKDYFGLFDYAVGQITAALKSK